MGAIVWYLLGGELLVGEVAEDVLGGLLVEVVVLDEADDGGVAGHVAELTDEGADAATELYGSSGLVAVPEGHLAGFAGSGG